MTHGISSADISVVLQGPVRGSTRKAIDSIRRILPDSELIFSTWTGEDINGFDIDKKVIQQAPLAYVQRSSTGARNNLNRMIRSTVAGIRLASKPYILKMRSDMILMSDAFINSFDKYPARSSRAVFKHKVLVPLLYSRVSYRENKTPFYLSDWAAFGLREDILELFLDTDEVEEPEFTEWFKNRTDSPFGSTMLKMAPEQYIYYSFFRKHFKDVVMEDCSDVNEEIVLVSSDFIVSNFVIADHKESGFWLPKYNVSLNETEIGIDYLNLWNRLIYEQQYRKFCDPSYVINQPEIECLYVDRPLTERRLRLKKHYNSIFQSNSISKFLEELFVTLVCGVSFLFMTLKQKLRH